MYPARMDDRGRVKVPAPFKEYLEKFEDKRLFVTSLDRRIAQVYPIIFWRHIPRTRKRPKTWLSMQPIWARKLKWTRRAGFCSPRNCAESLGLKIRRSTCTISVAISKF